MRLIKRKIVVANEETLKKVYSYVELNYGKTYLTPVEEKKLNYEKTCKGEQDCGLYFTEDILKNQLKSEIISTSMPSDWDKNKYAYYDNHRVVKRNIEKLTDVFRKTKTMRQEESDAYG